MHKGVIFGLIGFASYSLADLNHKYTINIKGFDFFTYFFFMGLIAFILVSLIMLKFYNFKELFSQKPKALKLIFIRGCASIFSMSTGILAVSHIPMHIFYPIILLAPMFATIISGSFGDEKFSRVQFFMISVAFVGVLFLTKPWNFSQMSTDFLIGVGLAFLMMCSNTFITILSRYGLHTVNPMVTMWYGSGLWVVVISVLILLGHNLAPVPVERVPNLLIAGIFYTSGVVFFLKGYGIGPIKKVAPTGYTQLMWGVLFDIIFFNSYTTLSEVVGILLIAGVNFFNLYRKA